MHRSIIDIAKNRVKWTLTTLQYLPEDMFGRNAGSQGELCPPKRLNFVGGGDFQTIGKEFFRYFIDFGGLAPHHCVLDVGCGVGRMAIPLMGYLTTGSYEGFDIVNAGIKWSTRNITARSPNFRFQLADIYNKVYNPGGRYEASQYRFPYEQGTFDFVFLTSVATHLLPRDLEHYIAEVSRVLKPKGKTLITFFVLNEESRLLLSQQKSIYDFRDSGNGYWTISLKNPEHAVAYDEAWIRALYAKHGLKILDPIKFGSWSGRRDPVSGQDILVAEKM